MRRKKSAQERMERNKRTGGCTKKEKDFAGRSRVDDAGRGARARRRRGLPPRRERRRWSRTRKTEPRPWLQPRSQRAGEPGVARQELSSLEEEERDGALRVQRRRWRASREGAAEGTLEERARDVEKKNRKKKISKRSKTVTGRGWKNGERGGERERAVRLDGGERHAANNGSACTDSAVPRSARVFLLLRSLAVFWRTARRARAHGRSDSGVARRGRREHARRSVRLGAGATETPNLDGRRRRRRKEDRSEPGARSGETGRKREQD